MDRQATQPAAVPSGRKRRRVSSKKPKEEAPALDLKTARELEMKATRDLEMTQIGLSRPEADALEKKVLQDPSSELSVALKALSRAEDPPPTPSPINDLADGFSGHAKTQSVEQRQQIFVNGHRRLVQVCLGRAHQIEECHRNDPRVGSDTPTSLAATTAPCADGSRPRIFESKGPSLVQETRLASFFHVWG